MPNAAFEISYCPKFRVTVIIPANLLPVHAGMCSSAYNVRVYPHALISVESEREIFSSTKFRWVFFESHHQHCNRSLLEFKLKQSPSAIAIFKDFDENFAEALVLLSTSCFAVRLAETTQHVDLYFYMCV
jgi:hypothetical protein